MPDAHALLRDVLSHPDDPARRGVYADLLISEGDPRGTFIAQQSELARLSGIEPQYPALLRSTQRLQAKHERQWVREHVARIGIDPDSFGRIEISATLNAVFDRGFVVRIAMGLDDLDAQYEAIAATEAIEGPELLLPGTVGYGPHPVAASWTRLKIAVDDWVTSITLAEVLNWDLARLESLDLSGLDLGSEGARLLAGLDTRLGDWFEDYRPPPPFADGQLREVVLTNCGLGDEGLAVLVSAATLAPTRLDVAQNRIAEPESLDHLRADRLSRLVSLGLSGNNALGPHLGRLAGWETLRGLRHLSIPQSTPPEAFRALFDTPSGALRELDAASAKALLADPAAVADAAEAWLRLNLGTTSLGDAGLKALLAAPSTASVTDLALNGCSLSDKGLGTLVGAGLQRLTRLDVSSNKLTDAGIAALTDWEGLAGLVHLRLGNNRKVTAAGYQALIDAPGFDPVVLDAGKVSDATLAEALSERFGDALRIRT
ncbi:MAG: TIGR02996 domain-containing protein [Alphaproteobacteria bacterium]|nr:TIGR02996 domain-containing protein [Alphaproteobacteria bacterium]